HGAYFADNP
ncbi:unnamed protein product, partial [Rotaria sp. Silwood1]